MRKTVGLALLAAASWGAAPGAEVFRYGRFEAAFTASRDYPNPLKEEVLVHFHGPEGASDDVPAFWAGGRTWKVRYSPDRTGAYRYHTEASDGGLNGQTGQFTVAPYQGRNDLYRNGGPHLSENRRYLVQGYNKPWFYLADTAWNGALMATAEEWSRYLNDRAGKKFSAIQFVMTPWRGGRQDEKGQEAFTGTDPIRINPAFFERMDARVNAMNDAGLVAAPVLLWAPLSRDRESPGAVLPAEQAILLARYMVARYGAHHVIWFLGGDGNYRGTNAERWKTIGRAVFPNGRSRRPVTLHPQAMQSPWPEFKDEPWVDLFACQSGQGGDAAKWRWNATQGPAADWKIEPHRPVMDTEINSEGRLDSGGKPIDAAAVRRAAWYSVLAAPPAGVAYGAHGIWSWSRKPEVPSEYPKSGTARPWQECLNYPGAKQMTVLRDVLMSMEWWSMVPDQSVFSSLKEDPEFRDYPMASRASDHDFALLYLPAGPALELDLSAYKQDLKAVWIDPRTGLRKPAGTLHPAYGVQVPAPGEGDWLLLLRK